MKKTPKYSHTTKKPTSKSSSTKNLGSNHQETLIKLALIHAMVTSESQVDGLKKIKKDKAKKKFYTTCTSIIAFNNDMIELKDKEGDAAQSFYQNILIKLAKATGFTQQDIQHLHASLDEVKWLAGMRHEEAVYRQNNPRAKSFGAHIVLTRPYDLSRLTTFQLRAHFAVLCKPEESIQQTLHYFDERSTPLREAVHLGYLPLIESLLKQGAKPLYVGNGVDHHSLHVAIILHKHEIVKTFCDTDPTTMEEAKKLFIKALRVPGHPLKLYRVLVRANVTQYYMP